jgi:hypothetical protein
LKPVPEKTKRGVYTCFEQQQGISYVLPICKFCEANAGHNQQLRLLKVKWGTIRKDGSPLLFISFRKKLLQLVRKSVLLHNKIKNNVSLTFLISLRIIIY